MLAVFVQKGDSIDYVPIADVKAGDVVAVNELLGIVNHDAKAGELTSLAVTGIFDFPKITGGGTAMALGTKVYWNPGVKLAFNSPGGSTLIGIAVLEALDAAETVRVRLER
jgi:predicted RecA/RadA family phage recombinase